jgi:hypothetical protein
VLQNCRDSIMPERIECVNDRSPLIAEEQRSRNISLEADEWAVGLITSLVTAATG